MQDEAMQATGKSAEATSATSSWPCGNMPEQHADLKREVVRLQRAIAALIAIGAVTEGKARQAYDIAGR